MRALAAEAGLAGRPLDAAALEQAIEQVWSEAKLRTSAHRATTG